MHRAGPLCATSSPPPPRPPPLVTSLDSTNSAKLKSHCGSNLESLGVGSPYATPGPIGNMFHGRFLNMGCGAILGERPFYWRGPPPLVQLPHRSKGTGPHSYRSSCLGSPMGETSSPISIRQPSGSSVSEFRILSVPHPGTPTPVSIFLLGILAIHTLSQTYTRSPELCLPMHFHRIGFRPTVVSPTCNPTPSPIPSTLQDLLLAPDTCWTSPYWRRGSGPLCPRHRQQHHEDWEATFPQVLRGHRFDPSSPHRGCSLSVVAHLMQFTSIRTYLSSVCPLRKCLRRNLVFSFDMMLL